MWTGMLFNLAWAVVLVVATLLLVPAHGGLGLAWAYLIAYAMHTVWQMTYMELKLAPHALRGSAPAVLLSIAVLLPVCVLGRTALLPDALLFAAACYPLAALCVRSLRRAG